MKTALIISIAIFAVVDILLVVACCKVSSKCSREEDRETVELKHNPCAFGCKHCLAVRWNEIGEKLAFCEIWGEWKNITLGDCVGNCESEEWGGTEGA